ncbi:MAG: hypothetical protein AB8B69_04385 [Chitinophagales bacterium]
MKELEEFAQCKLFHSNKRRAEKVITLFEELITLRYQIVKPKKEDLYRRLFGSENINISKLDNHIYQAIDVLEKYLVHKYQNEDRLRFDSALLNALEGKNLEKPFNRLKSKLQRDLSKEVKKSSKHFYASYSIADISLEIKKVRSVRELRLNNIDLDLAVLNLDLFFLTNQLNYACNAVNIRNILQAPQYNFPLLEIILDELPKTSYFRLPLIQIYWNAYKLLMSNENEYYVSLKELLFIHYPILPKYYQTNFFTYLKNYCIKEISSGDHSYFAEFWEISIFQLENKLMMELNLAAHKNLITTGVMLALKEEKVKFKDVLQFLEQHTDKLSQEFRGDATTYAQAYISFYQNDFETIPEKLITSQEPLTIYRFEDVFYQVDARRLLIMTYFCLDQDDNFDKMWNNLNAFLNDKIEVIPALYLEKNRQFLIIIKKLFWLDGNNRKEREEKLKELQKDIEEAKNISDRTWLLKQIELKSN